MHFERQIYFVHFERRNAFQNAYNYIFYHKKKCVPTLPKIIRPVTRNTLFYFALKAINSCQQLL